MVACNLHHLYLCLYDNRSAGDVAGIDVNCGCPKRFSLVSGMGAALLSNQERLLEVESISECSMTMAFGVNASRQILRNLIAKVPLPITCKIRSVEARVSD